MKDKIGWIEGLKGYACLFVLLGHAATCMLPAVYFGDQYQAHSYIESFIHKSPFSLLFNSSSMVCLFFFLSGYLIALKEIKISVISLYHKYMKLFPMIVIGVAIPYIVMRIGFVYHIKLADWSFALDYVAQYNCFQPRIMGKDGIIVDIFLKSILRSSKYNTTLWFLAVYFWGSIVAEIVQRFIKMNKIKICIYFLLFFACMFTEGIDWKLPYCGMMYLGAIIGCVINNKRKIINNRILTIFIFIIGLYFISPLEYVGIYRPLVFASGVSLWIRAVGIVLLILAINSNDNLKKIFENRVSKALGKYSFGIYVTQWGIIISIGCYVVYSLRGGPYLLSATLGIVTSGMVTITLSVVFMRFCYSKYLLLLKDKKLCRQKER